MSELWIATALVLVIEGLLPALSPRSYRRAIASLTGLDDRTLRSAGLGMMIFGALLIYLLKN